MTTEQRLDEIEKQMYGHKTALLKLHLSPYHTEKFGEIQKQFDDLNEFRSKISEQSGQLIEEQADLAREFAKMPHRFDQVLDMIEDLRIKYDQIIDLLTNQSLKQLEE